MDFEDRDIDETLRRYPRLYRAMQGVVNRLPETVRWAPHNVLGHPVMEFSLQLGWNAVAILAHEGTVPGNRRLP